MRVDLGLWHASDTRHDRQEKRELRQRRAAYEPAIHAVITEMTECAARRDYQAAWDIFQAHAGGPSEALTSTALSICAKARWLERAWKVWGAMPADHRSVVDYSIMLDLCARCKRDDQAEELFREMSRAGVEPNLITYNSLIKAFAMTGRPGRALEIFHGIPREVFETAGDKSRQSTYQTVMSAFARSGDYAGAYALFMQMLEAGVKPVIMHYTVLLTACARTCDVATADGVFASMVSAHIQPDVPSYTILMSCNRQNLARCKQIMAEMEGKRLQPSTLTQLELLEAYVAAGDGPGARDLLGSMGTSRLHHPKLARLEVAASQMA